MLFSRKNVNMCIVNIRSFYAANKIKMSIIIWPSTVAEKINPNYREIIFFMKPMNIN